MSASIAEIGFFVGAGILAIFTAGLPLPLVILIVAMYVVVAWTLWIYSPYVHEHSAAMTGNRVVREQEWGF